VIGMSSSPARVTVVIPNWNGREWLKECLNALKIQNYRNFEICVVDDASTDGSADFVETVDLRTKVIRLHVHKGFAGAVNAGIKAASGEYILLLNNDTLPSVSFLQNLVLAMDTMPPEVGSLASCMQCMENPILIDDAGDFLTWYGQALKRGHGRPVTEFKKSEEVFSACAGAALYRKAFLTDTGGFDEGFGSYLEDIDLGLRGRLMGYRCVFVPEATVFHKGHGSNLPHRMYVRLVTRNRLMLMGKNIPFLLIIRYFPNIVAGQLALVIQHGAPWESFIGYLSFIQRLPKVVRDRRQILSTRKLTDQEIGRLLLLSPEGISLPEWFTKRIRREFH
jgi:GT2 family glycosyltransferase